MQPNNWPRPRDYQEAIQTPAVCFSDSRLRNAEIHTNKLGVPLAAAGKSAVVFQATANSADVALRCFTRAAPEQRLRYQELHAHLAPEPPSYMVDFTYRDQEMWVEGNRYPMVEMGWVAGDALDVWVREHLGRGNDLADQAAAWLLIMNDMQTRELAHGDLANDNCLVSGSQLKLIDYDGCFIPALAGKHPGEDGNPHFQHPGRAGYYAGDMDAFPSLVIYLSLLALQSDASLWQHHTDKNLIFAATDYKLPRKTPIWKALAKNPDARVVSLAAALADMCEASVATLPSLRAVVTGAEISLSGQRSGTSLDEEVGSLTQDDGESPWWSQEALQGGQGTRPLPVPAPSVPPSAPDWLEDHVGSPRSPIEPTKPVPTPAKPQAPAPAPAKRHAPVPAVAKPVPVTAKPPSRPVAARPPSRPAAARRTAPPPAAKSGRTAATVAVFFMVIVLLAIILALVHA
jgi:hypothetical protein